MTINRHKCCHRGEEINVNYLYIYIYVYLYLTKLSIFFLARIGYYFLGWGSLSPIKVHVRFGGRHCLNFQGRIISQENAQQESSNVQRPHCCLRFSGCFIVSFWNWSWRQWFSAASVSCYGTREKYIPGDSTLHCRHCQYLRYTQQFVPKSSGKALISTRLLIAINRINYS
jgi:hypothetical protein